jgi:DNA invertase Pin-like site-specific DNA recombinase
MTTMPSPNKTQIKAALYARVSTVNHGQDPEVQLHPLRKVAEQRGWRVIVECVDVGVSGAKESRPELDKLLDLVRGGHVQVVAVHRFDRLARSVRHLLSFLDECRMNGVDFISVSESVDTTTPVGKMVFTFLGAVAEFERSLIVERVRAGVNRAKASGKHCGRPRRDLDLRGTAALLEAGHGLRETASMLGLPRSTLRRRLSEAGLWCGCAAMAA